MAINPTYNESIYVVSYFSENGKFSNLFCTHDPDYAVRQIHTMAKAFGEDHPQLFTPFITRMSDKDGYIFYAVWQDATMETLVGRYFIDKVGILPYMASRTIN